MLRVFEKKNLYKHRLVLVRFGLMLLGLIFLWFFLSRITYHPVDKVTKKRVPPDFLKKNIVLTYPSSVKIYLDQLLVQYLRIHHALIEDDFKLAQLQSLRILTMMIKQSKFQVYSEEKKLLDTIINRLQILFMRAYQSENLTAYRLLFSKISYALEELILLIGLQDNRVIQKYSCKFRYDQSELDVIWFQDSDLFVKNPYYGVNRLNYGKKENVMMLFSY